MKKRAAINSARGLGNCVAGPSLRVVGGVTILTEINPALISVNQKTVKSQSSC
jgi:hypothetical protein